MRRETNAVNLMTQLTVWQEFPGCSPGRECSERELSSFLKLGSRTLKFENVKAARICGEGYQRGREGGRKGKKERERERERERGRERTHSGNVRGFP